MGQSGAAIALAINSLDQSGFTKLFETGIEHAR